MPFGAHSVAVIEGGHTALRESSSGELTDPPWRAGTDVSRLSLPFDQGDSLSA
jgi:hypothetical protein